MRQIKWIFIFGLVLLTAACGYHFEGGGYLKDNVQKVAVKMFANHSSQTSAGPLFTSALIQEIVQESDTKVADESIADAIITGSIQSITFAVLSRSSSESVTERRVTAVIDVSLTDRDGKTLWSLNKFAAKEEYTVSDNAVADEAAKQQAVEKISQRTAELLVGKMLTNF